MLGREIAPVNNNDFVFVCYWGGLQSKGRDDKWIGGWVTEVYLYFGLSTKVADRILQKIVRL